MQGASDAKHRSDESSRHCSMMHKPLRFNPQAKANLKFKGTTFTQQTHTHLLTAHTLLLTSVGSSLGMMGEQRGVHSWLTECHSDIHTHTCRFAFTLVVLTLLFFFKSFSCFVSCFDFKQTRWKTGKHSGWMYVPIRRDVPLSGMLTLVCLMSEPLH